MTQARVSHFRRGFGHVVASGAQQFGGTFHPQIAQELRNGKTDFARKNSTEIKWAATHLLAERFQRRGIGQIACQQFLRPLYSFACDALLPHAKKFRVLRREKKMRHEFERLALVPKNLRGFRHRRIDEARHHDTLLN